MSATVAHLNIYDNRLVRDVVVAHRVKSMHLDSNEHVADRKSTRLNSSHMPKSRMPSSA